MINVIKRDGTVEPFQASKIIKVIQWAIEGMEASVEEVTENASLNIVDGITTEQIHNVIIDSAAGLINEETPDYQFVAGRLLNFSIRKKVWGSKDAPKLIDVIRNNIDRGFYTKNILNWYTESEINEINSYIDHDSDLTYSYCSVKQLCDKYMVKNQVTGELHETPQIRYIIAALTIFHKYDPLVRLSYIKEIYDCFRKFKINLATPQLAGLGTNNNSFASCCLINQLDTSESINATNMAIAQATCAGYGIGVDFSRMRAIKSPVKNRTILHPGVVPFLKIAEANTKAWQKNGVRGGSATVNFPFWHAEIETIVQLKNANTGTNDSRVFNLDYCIGMSKLIYERFLKNQNITLFCPKDVPELSDAFGLDEFDELYTRFETERPNRGVVPARDLISLIVKEGLETGRIYLFNVDHANKYGSWVDRVGMTNLCVEITQAIDPLRFVNDPESEIGVCILSAINWLTITSDEDFALVCEMVVRMLDELIDIQDYFDVAAKNFCQNKRSLGIGITNLAAFLAKNEVAYTDKEALPLVDEWMEKQQYFLLKASIKLAKEKGVCKKFHTSKYAHGWLPIDKEIKGLPVDRTPTMDWEGVREELKEYGARHCTFTAGMPCESSSAAQNVTNGFEPARSLKTYKASKKSSIPCLVPNVKTHAHHYQLAFEMGDNIGYLNVCGAIQKWMDMAISVNQYFNPAHYADGKIPYTQIIKETLHAYKVGLKSRYYLNTEDQNQHFAKESGCASGACSL